SRTTVVLGGINVRISIEEEKVHEYLLFFFSSRRRHTRLQGDWSSDVCSSDLAVPVFYSGQTREPLNFLPLWVGGRLRGPGGADRSEERRVGKECRWEGAA